METIQAKMQLSQSMCGINAGVEKFPVQLDMVIAKRLMDMDGVLLKN